MLNASQISTIINEVWDGVERSKLGDIYKKDEKGGYVTNAEGCYFVNNIPLQTFQNVLSSVVPKDVSGEMKVSD